ncbi:phage tail tape measure protein [Aminobacter sp. AP02]|uniref:phage tail tape measure protein n=1 Tax=Aminobacter sp. AP02 TaxID=2135737 RepID=UPI000D6BE4EA|nr:phage tail tape measure protein [Aminobacter sp. AP02]PWK66944.1 TP901 family phage tail tape measure protein [Aminobacter sp. AP02]
MATLTSKLIVQLLDRASGPAKGISAAIAGINGQVGRFNRGQAAAIAPMRGFAGGLVAMTAGYVGVTQGIRATAGAAMSFEDAMADVRKVVDVNDEQFQNMSRSVIGLSKDLPVTADGIASIYAAAAQSGVATQELEGFSDGVVKVSTAWETAVDTTGESLAKIKTALGRDLKGTFLLADAINEVSNVSAASAPDMLEFTNRVAAFAETAGFAAEDAIAFGGAMVGSGFEPEVAATSFRNLTRALTKGTQATKSQRTAFKALGLDAVKTAKGMQKNAVGTTLDVLDRIKKLPEYQQISIATALFGDEARGLAPLFKNADELRRLLKLTGDAANYSGSAFKEYIARANTTSNVLTILKNKVADVFRGMGDNMLPDIKEAALGVGDVLDTLGERASIFDRFSTAMQGFTQGLGFDGGVRETVSAIGDLLFGKADGSGAGDQLGRIFAQFREGGAAIKEFWDANKESPVAKFLGEVSGQGFSLFVASTGIVMLAGAVAKLGRALLIVSGARAALGIVTALAKAGKWTLWGTPEAVAEASGGKPTGPKTTAPKGGGFASKLRAGLRGGIAGAIATVVGEYAINSGFRAAGYDPDAANEKFGGVENWWNSIKQQKRFFLGAAADERFSAKDHFRISKGGADAPQVDVAAALRETVVQTKPTGVQQVQVTNPQKVAAPINVTVYATTNASAADIGAAVGSRVKALVEGMFSDGGDGGI